VYLKTVHEIHLTRHLTLIQLSRSYRRKDIDAIGAANDG
jgi:hypothetical protein